MKFDSSWSQLNYCGISVISSSPNCLEWFLWLILRNLKSSVSEQKPSDHALALRGLVQVSARPDHSSPKFLFLPIFLQCTHWCSQQLHKIILILTLIDVISNQANLNPALIQEIASFLAAAALVAHMHTMLCFPK